MAKKEEAVVETETPEVEEVVETETPAAVEKPATAKEIAEAVAAAVRPAGPSAQDRANQEFEAKIARTIERTGKTREEVLADEQERRTANLNDNMPLYEELGTNRAEKLLADMERPDLMDKVKEKMATFPAFVRAQPQAWQDAAKIILGENYKKTVKTSTEDTTERSTGKVLGGSTRQNTGLTDGGRTSGGARKPAGKPKEYTEFEQKIIDETCGGDAAEYERYQAGGRRLPPRQTEAVSSKNKADLAEEALTKRKSL